MSRGDRVLVTGGAGFIGSALVWALNTRGIAAVVIADRLGTTDKWRNLAPLRFEDYLEADDLFPRLESGSLGEFSLVLHMGACSSTLERDASYLARNNFEFTKTLARWSLANEVRFVYASSAATYGDGAAGLYNVGSGEAHTWLDLAHALFAAMGREPQIEFIEMPEAMRGRYQYYTRADISRLRATGYESPTTPLDAAVADYVTRYLDPDHRLGDE